MFSSTQNVERLWTSMFFDIGWQGLCVAGLALVLAAVLQHGWPRLAYGLLLVALLKFLVPTSVGSPIGLAAFLQNHRVSSFPISSQETDGSVAGASSEAADHGLASRAAEPTAAREIAAASSDTEWGTAEGESLYSALQSATLASKVSPEPAPSWLMIAAAIHLIGSVGVAVYFACGWLHARRLVRTNAVVPRETIAVWRQLQLQRVVPRRCRLVVTDQPVSPFAFGIWNPVVVVPGTLLKRLEPEQQKIVLAHEGGHHAAHHPLHLLLQLLVLILWWFHPLVWVLHRRLRLLREAVCDLDTLHALKITRLSYSRLLGELSSWQVSRGSRPVTMAVAMHPIAWRISHLANNTAGEGRTRRILRPLLLVVFALAVLPASGPTLGTVPQSPTTAAEDAGSEADDIAPGARTILGSSNSFLNAAESGHILMIPGTDFVVCYSSAATVYSLDPWQHVATLVPGAEGSIVRGAAVTPDGSQLLHAVANGPNKIELQFYSIPEFELQSATEHPARGLGGSLDAIYFSPDAKRVYFKTGFQVMRLDLQEESMAEVIYSRVKSIVQSRDGRTIGVVFYSEQQGPQLATYDTRRDSQTALTKIEDANATLGVTPDQKQFVLFSRSAARAVRFFDASSLEPVRSVAAPPGKIQSAVMTDLAWWRLISGPVSDDFSLQKIDLASGKETVRLPIGMGRIGLQAIDEQKERILARNWDRLFLLDAKTARPLVPVTSSLGSAPRALFFAGASGDRLVASDWRSADLWRWRPAVSLLGSTDERETVLDVSPSGAKLIVGGVGKGYRIVDLSGSDMPVTLQARPPRSSPSVVFFSSSGETVRILTNRYILEDYDVVTGERLSARPLLQIAPVESWQSLSGAATQSYGRDPFGSPNKTPEQIKRNQADARAEAVTATSFGRLGDAATVSDNGRYLAIIRDQRLAIADLEAESIHYEVSVDLDDRARMDLSNDANTILIWQNPRSRDSRPTGRVRLLTTAADSPRLQREFSEPITAGLSHDGRFVAVGSQWYARSLGAQDLWLEIIDTSTGQTIATRSIDSPATAIVWSRDGRHVATGHADSTVSVWNVSEFLSGGE